MSVATRTCSHVAWVCLLLAILPNYFLETACAEQMAHIQTDSDVLTHVPFAQIACGGRITIDSLSAIPSSTTSPYLPYYPTDEANTGKDYVTFATRTISAAFGRLVEDTLSSAMTSIVLFEVDASSVAASGVCDFYWDPRPSWRFGGIELSSVTIASLQSTWYGNASTSSCPASTFGFAGIAGLVSVNNPQQILSQAATNPLQLTAKVTALNSRMFGSDTFNQDDVFPVTALAPGGCKVVYALIASHHGKYTSLGKWLPLVIYTALSIPVMTLRGRRHIREGAPLGHLSLCLAFIGFAGCCAGMSIELASWHYPLRPFPFPSGVTMFLCSAIGYGLILFGLMYGHPTGCVATFSVMHMLLYGISVGVIVGYFFRQLLVIGGIAIGMLVLTNLLMTILAARFTAQLPNSFRTHTGSSTVGTLLTWFPLTALVLPVSHLALQVTWSGVTAFHSQARRKRVTSNADRRSHSPNSGDALDQLESQMEVVRLHSVSAALLMLFIHDTSTLALLIAASIYHAPFVIALLPVLVVIVLHFAYIGQEYTSAWRRWGKVSLWVSLDTALNQYARHEAEVTPSRFARIEGDTNVAGHYDEDMCDDGAYTPKGADQYYPQQPPPQNRQQQQRSGSYRRAQSIEEPSPLAQTSANYNPPARGAAVDLVRSPRDQNGGLPSDRHNSNKPTFRTVAVAAVASQRVASSSVRSTASSQQQVADTLKAREAAYLRRMELE